MITERNRPQTMSRNSFALWIPCIAFCGLLLAGCGKETAPVSTDPKTDGDSVIFPANSVQTAGIQSMAIARQPVPHFQLNGRVTWNEDRTVRVYTPFAGRVAAIYAQPGDKVAKSQRLASIASPEFGQAQADARRAESDYTLAEKNLARVRELEDNGVASRKDLQGAEADYGRSKAELTRARERLNLYGSKGENVDQTYVLASPIAGTVVEKAINPGQELRPDQMVSNAPPLFVITDPETLWIQLDASEKDLPLLGIGKAITIRSPAYRDDDFPAKITAVSDFLDPTTRTIKVRALIANTDHKLKSEMFVTADIGTDGQQELLVPARSVFFQGGKYFVFIDEGGGKYTRREVHTGDVRGPLVEILEGLREGEKVVNEGSLMLQQVLRPRRVQK